ncbi:DUF4184 family protein [Hymenobacter cellulosilyticus]|uniref:DUF4184 family protein n=1 Tax=Hymenobacter cellulosilyticus TaxID=2932248 RepID=A0A8T9Q810_9BACT|nr:DUF4184 family protein [Hymenobacter cellulosilyticus]UOQ72208.1 DUF4184 family protein [Hymenobacter cellulosilyticus]
MPFTPAHPALVLPLFRVGPRRLSATALVLGAMAPDFEYFLRLRPDGIYGHTWAGIFWLDLPLVLVFAGLFHNLVKLPLVQCLPTMFRSRLLPLTAGRWGWRRLFSGPVLLGALLGCLSHIFWDWFTHDDGLVVLHWAWLRQTLPGFGPEWPLYQFLQYVSTFIGLGSILWYVLQLPAQPTPPLPPTRTRFTFWLATGAVLVLLWGPFMIYSARIWPFDANSVLVTGMSAGLVGLLVAAGVLRRRLALAPGTDS